MAVKVVSQLHSATGLQRVDLHAPGPHYGLPDGWQAQLTILALPDPLPSPQEMAAAKEALALLPPERFGSGIRLRPMALTTGRGERLRLERPLLVGAVVWAGDGSRIEATWSSDGRLRTVHHGPPEGASELERRLRQVLGLARRGRPPIFQGREECLQVLRQAAQELRRQGHYPSQDKVAQLLSQRGMTWAADPKTALRSWLRRFAISWHGDVLS